VSDEATTLLVEHFYNAFLRGRSDVASALRAAMLATRSRLASNPSREALNPSEWGPFFVLRDGGVRPSSRGSARGARG
jgi:CHAT domain-containing protein